MGQIVGYVSDEEARGFAVYAELLGVDASALANLLLRRETRLSRLSCLSDLSTEDRCVKITAHFKDTAFKASFTDHASRHGLRAGPAATRLFRAELEERWLEACLSIPKLDST